MTNDSGPFGTQTIKQISIFEQNQSCFLLSAGDSKFKLENILQIVIFAQFISCAYQSCGLGYLYL